MNFRHIAVMIPLILLVGCARNDTDNEYDRALQARWSEVSESEFPAPNITPYDANPDLREQYLNGYADGVRDQLYQFKNIHWEFGDRLPVTADNRTYFAGWGDGAKEVVGRSIAISEAVLSEREKK